MMDDSPTELTQSDIDEFVRRLESCEFDIKLRPCLTCSQMHLPNYSLMECDECFFSIFPKEQVEEFYRIFFE